MGGDGREFRVASLKVFKKRFPDQFIRTQSKGFETGADRGSETQFRVRIPKYGWHFFHHHAKARAALLFVQLRFFKIREHGVDGGAEIGEFILAADFQTSGKISARSDVRDSIAQIGDARKYHPFQEV